MTTTTSPTSVWSEWNKRRTFKAVPERLRFTRNAVCAESSPQLTLVGILRPQDHVNNVIRLCWDAADNRLPGYWADMSTAWRMYTADGRLVGWRGFGRGIGFGRGYEWNNYNDLSTSRPQNGYVHRTWMVARAAGETSRTLRLDEYDDGTWGFVECDHLVLC